MSEPISEDKSLLLFDEETYKRVIKGVNDGPDEPLLISTPSEFGSELDDLLSQDSIFTTGIFSQLPRNQSHQLQLEAPVLNIAENDIIIIVLPTSNEDISKFYVITPEPLFRKIENDAIIREPKMFLTRDKDYVFSVFYNQCSVSLVEWFLNISLIPDSDIDETEILCSNSKHNKDFLFACNDIGVRFMASYQIPLSSIRRNREISLKFFCNGDCEYMKKMTKLKFSIVDGNNNEWYQQTIPIQIKERPSRNKKNLQADEQPFTYQNYLTAFNEHNIIRKLVPNSTDLTTPGCEFNIRQANVRYGLETLIREDVEKPIDFEITYYIPQFGALFLRFMIVDPKSPESLVICNCQNNAQHILYSNGESIPQDFNGFYPDERRSLRIPLSPKVTIFFRCPSGCFLKAKKEPGLLIVILENDNGEMFGRRHFNFTIVQRPDRPIELCPKKNTRKKIKKPIKRKSSSTSATLRKFRH